MSRLVSALLFCAVVTAAVRAQNPSSSQAGTSDEAVVVDRMDNLVRFEDDGTGVRETTAVIRVQSQAGVKELGQLIFGYSSATEKLDVDYVRVRKPDGRVVETPASTAQDFAPEVLREAPTYSDYRERHISVAGLQAGDVLEYHTVTHVTTPLAPHEFWYEHSFEKDVAVHEERLQIDVPKARTLKIKSPERKYETQESGERRIYTWTVRDFVPDRKHDREAIREEPDYTPDVQLSTFADWQQVGQWYAKLQGNRVVVDDSVRNKAAELTRGATTPVEKAPPLRLRGVEHSLCQHFLWRGTAATTCRIGSPAERLRRLRGQTHAAAVSAESGKHSKLSRADQQLPRTGSRCAVAGTVQPRNHGSGTGRRTHVARFHRGGRALRTHPVPVAQQAGPAGRRRQNGRAATHSGECSGEEPVRDQA